MLGKLLIIGAAAAIIMIPTALSAQMGGAVNAGAAVRGAIVPGYPWRGFRDLALTERGSSP